MKLEEIKDLLINEMHLVSNPPATSLMDLSSPAVQRNIKISADFTKKINATNSPEEVFSLVYNESKKRQHVKLCIHLYRTKHSGSKTFYGPNSVISYNPESGELVLADNALNNNSKMLTFFKTSLNGVKYEGREQSSVGKSKTYLFTIATGHETYQEPNTEFKPKNIYGAKKSKMTPDMLDAIRREGGQAQEPARNAFGAIIKKENMNLEEFSKKPLIGKKKVKETTGDEKFDSMMGKISGSQEPQNFDQERIDRVGARAENPDQETIDALNKMMYDMHMTMQTANKLMQKLTRGR